MSLLSTDASPQVSPGSPVGSGSSLLLPLARSCASRVTAARIKLGSQLAQDFEHWVQALRKVAGIQKGGGTQEHSGCPGIAWALQECCTPLLWAPQILPQLKSQEICAISVFSMFFACKSNPQISPFKSLSSFKRNRGRSIVRGNAEPQVSVVKSQRKRSRKGQKGSGRRAEVPGIVSCTYRKNNTAFPFSLAAVEMLWCKHWKHVYF